MKGMKAYVFDTGYTRVDSNLISSNDTILTYPNQNEEPRWTICPCYAVLIDHPRVGYIMFDMGCRSDSNEYWSDTITTLAYYGKSKHGTLLEQMAGVGVKPADVKYVIVSHMHMDHFGNVREFMNTAEFFVSLEEIRFAHQSVAVSPDTKDHGWYVREEIQLPVMRYHYLEEDEEILPGITALMLPGHTPGTMGALVELESGNVIITSDAVNVKANYNGNMPGIIRDSVRYLQSIKKLHKIAEKNHAQVWFGHDPDQFDGIRKAPNFY